MVLQKQGRQHLWRVDLAFTCRGKGLALHLSLAGPPVGVDPWLGLITRKHFAQDVVGCLFADQNGTDH